MSQEPQGLEGWAFLVARGRRLGWRTILVPDFIAAADESGLLTENVSGDVSPSGPPRIVNIGTASSGELTAIFRTARFSSADLHDEQGEQAPDLVTDQHGRPLDLLFGFVTRQRVSEPDEGDLIAVKNEATAAYRHFLADETGFATERSRARPLRSRPGMPLPRPSQQPQPETEHAAYRENRPPTMAPAPSSPQSTPMQPKAWVLPLLGVLVVAFIFYRLVHPTGRSTPQLVSPSSGCTSVAPGGSGICTVTVRSAGPGAVAVSKVWVDSRPPPGNWAVRPGCQGTITADKACTITVDLTAPAESAPGTTFKSQLVVTYDARTAPFPLAVTVAAP